MKTDVFCFTDRVITYGQDADEAAALIKNQYGSLLYRISLLYLCKRLRQFLKLLSGSLIQRGFYGHDRL